MNKGYKIRASQEELEPKHQIISFKPTQVIWLIAGILEGLIALRVIMKILGANPESPIAVLIYGITGLFLTPFNGLINSLTSGNLIFELSSLVAILFYGLTAWIVEKIIWLIFYSPGRTSVEVTEPTTNEQHTNR